MRRIFAMSMIITFLSAQYSYTNAACKLCGQSDEMIQRAGFSKPDPEEVAYIFDQLELNEKVDLINPNETIKLEYMDA